MFDILDIAIIAFIIIIIFFLFHIRENFAEAISESESESEVISESESESEVISESESELEAESENIYAKPESESNEEDIDNNKDSKAFFKMKPIDPRDALWDHKIDYCLNRGGKLEDIDLKETLLNYKPKVILY